ncbi:heparinase II/III family protein [Phycisphaerales bacterium AB-hyl4]|uniref:Heparinase II/III family protein n=1 Tax=Natronomicrosphaera hydrolytica TaxID=3242702 RepID=A0ABV4U428_9BACT
MPDSTTGPAQRAGPGPTPARALRRAAPRLLDAIKRAFRADEKIDIGSEQMTPGQFAARQKKKPLLTYEAFASTDRWSADTQENANEVIELGWQLKTLPRLKLQPPIAWDEICGDHRSLAFHLHSWDALSPVLATYHHTEDFRYLRYALDVALDWANQYRSPKSDTGFAWYDMAIGMRAYRLAYIVDAACRQKRVDRAEIATLMQCVVLHMQALADDDNFAAHSNHGFYLAAGQLAMARRLAVLPGMETQKQQAYERMHALIKTQFTDEGVHREHSPDYHRMVHDTFHGLVRSGLLAEPTFQAIESRIQKALAWFILPNGAIAMFGDTPHHVMNRKRDLYSHIDNPALRFVYSGGNEGQPPQDTTRVFREAGYAVIRDRWPTNADDFTDCSYLAQTCCFHSRVHKHADDLSFIWYDHNQELLVDAGRFGYRDPSPKDSSLRAEGFYYAHPSRVYIETTRAHNAVEIDRKSYPRRDVTPYGSALRRAGQTDAVHYIESSVEHFKNLQHTRVLYYRPRLWLVVYDVLWDVKRKPHDFHQRFHFAPELTVQAEGEHPRIPLNDSPLQLHMRPLLPAEPLAFVHGQEAPELLGWISRIDDEITPCWTGGYAIDNAPHAEFATLFSFGQQPPCEEQSQSPSEHRLDLQWQQDGQRHQLNLPRLRGVQAEPGQPLDLAYKTAST